MIKKESDMKKLFLLISLLFLTIGAASAFSNSLDGSDNSVPKWNNNFTSPQSNTYTNTPATPYIPKEHTGFTHGDGRYVNPQMNDTRYNSNCQFGQCIPGGLNPNNQ